MANEFSPELALVDPELAVVLRASLPEPGDCLARRRVAPAPVVPVVPAVPEGPPATVASVPPVSHVPVGLAVDEQRRPVRRRWRGVKRAVFALVAVGIVGIPFLAFGSPDYPRLEGSATPTAAGTDRARVPAQLPASRIGTFSGPRVEQLADARRRVLTWPKVRKASLYNVVFVNGTRRVDRWITGTSTIVRTTIPVRRPSARRPLVYRWYVYPLFRQRGGVRFGKLLAQGIIRVPQGSLRR